MVPKVYDTHRCLALAGRNSDLVGRGCILNIGIFVCLFPDDSHVQQSLGTTDLRHLISKRENVKKFNSYRRQSGFISGWDGYGILYDGVLIISN